MYKVLPETLWIGHALDARSPRTLLDSGIAAVVDLAHEEPPAQLPRELVYCRFPIMDGAGNKSHMLRLAVGTVVKLLETNTPTLVACSGGMSRSPIIAALALSIHRNEPADRSLQSNPSDLSASLWNDVLKACDRH